MASLWLIQEEQARKFREEQEQAMTTTKRVDVARLSELLEKATPGPWSARENHFSRWEILGGRGILANVATPNDPASPPESWRECEANAALIAEAITSLPALLQQLAELQDCLRYANRANATIKTMCSSAEAKLAERDAEIEAVVGAKEHWRKAAEGNYLAKEAAQRAREECVADVERRFLSVRDMLPGDYITGYTEALAHIRAAFLAANGEQDHG